MTVGGLKDILSHGVQVVLGYKQLAELLDLPDGSIITSVFEDNDWTSEKIRLFISHECLPERDQNGQSVEAEAVIIHAPCGHHLLHLRDPNEAGE